ncbi:hypothetical protein M774_03255 [Neisseria gonorrhoeae MU_NG5]|uniref:Uncharacterized protein n=1 Tax=Neisseria gonorrhoeae (strain NCCP11945) TaxID=521006 RepID=B4RM32_NEIG2|nr:Hypothetical protein NGK_1191 [Neisseria gonorrhoeae NCCP11945]KLR93457.1 hypothetical protein M685_11740 [Neisseria gonorrhoeae SK16259]KLS10636.1 hypothetical protein M716_11030 [Neisseria gonorrhoeae SK32402]KLS26383.1 hypothetical protein M733_02740 [Neisseria gonorrhoeae ATL_2011_05-13]KLS41518.1 hypothetical protein M720_11045 [Neisseria gonorrhoeae SK39420]KLS60624.1 hypothetical protein M743_01450 [Neisseria gonorrhoeae NYC_2011_05_13]KLS85999.1 hypothetical protein M774_03255 [Nei
MIAGYGIGGTSRRNTGNPMMNAAFPIKTGRIALYFLQVTGLFFARF